MTRHPIQLLEKLGTLSEDRSIPESHRDRRTPHTHLRASAMIKLKKAPLFFVFLFRRENMALSGIVNKPTIQPQEVLKDSDSALRPVKGVPQTALNPVEGDTTLSVGGDRALIDRLSAQLPGFKGVVPVAYRDGLVSVRQDLAQTARKTNDRDLAQAITRAAKLIDQEQGLIVAMDIYRNLLHRA